MMTRAASRWLQLGPGLELPVDTATEPVGVLGQRGSGKSNVLVVFAEELWRCGVPWVAIDPKGDWYGIRSSADGAGPGLPVPVLGGLHGDIPLEPTSGAYVADLLVDQTLSAVLDVSTLSAGDLARFLIAFCHRLFDRHQGDPHVRTVIFEEAHRYIPQAVTSATAALKEATAKIPLEGRAFGLGSVTASQRSSRLHKDVLTQFSVLVAMRSPAKLDRDAIGGWVEEHDVSRELLRTLAELDSGEAWLWSPHYLHRADRVRFRRRWTFDSGATPKVGRTIRAPRTIADVDLAAIKEAMADTIERAKADDPKALRRQIADLERQLQVRPVEVRVVPVLEEDLVVRLEKALAPAAALLAELGRRLDPGRDVVEPAPNRGVPAVERSTATVRPSVARRERPPAERPRPASDAGELPGPQRKLLVVLATYGPRTKRQLALQAGYSVNGGGFNNPLGALRSAGYAERGDPIAITAAGLAALGDYDPLPSGLELLDRWLTQLPGPAAKILVRVAEAWPSSITKTDLAAATGYEPTGGGFNNPLGRLRTLELITRGNEISLTDEFGEAIS